MESAPALAPGIPADYYRRIFDAEEHHWWYVGMRDLSASLLGDRMRRPGSRLLDAGCGTGGFLRWALDTGAFASAAGVDVASSAIELARRRVPEADLRTSPLKKLPFADRSFDVVVANDVLQHIPEHDVASSLGELRRVLADDGAILVRTNGARRFGSSRDDWRIYDRRTLGAELERACFRLDRVTYVNTALSLLAALRGGTPKAPTTEVHGVPVKPPSPFKNAVGRSVLAAEVRWLRRPGRTLPYGHTLLALATRSR
jgi:SAM-dependent methyltransferase